MQLLIFVGLIMLSSFSFGSNSTCVNVSGDYSINFDPIGRENISSIVQTGCDSIALGLYKFNHQTGLKEEEALPSVYYVSKDHQGLCPSGHCAVFSADVNHIAFDRNGSVRVGGLSCSYSRVEWSLDDGDLKQTYLINDQRPPCIQAQKFEKVLKRFK